MSKGSSLKIICLLGLILQITACSPGYVIRAAYEQGKILARREKIETVIKSNETSTEEKRKLQLVLDARSYAEKMGLKPGKSYLTYSRLDREVLTWVVMGSKREDFILKTWWFPIVGTVPYKGYFDKADAEHAAKIIELDEFETWVRPSEAFSTLGWFDDPVLTPLLRHDDINIVNTVIHESLHRTYWLPGQVPFNESFANFVGTVGAINFYKDKQLACAINDTQCSESAQKMIALSNDAQEREYQFADLINELYEKLNSLYRSKVSKEEKLKQRVEIFEHLMQPIRQRYPQIKILKNVNNAEIMQLKIYLSHLHDFQALYQRCNNSLDLMLEKLTKLRETLKKDEDPFMLLGTL